MERQVVILEELLSYDPKPPFVCFIGHSNGGATNAAVCSEKVSQIMNVKGKKIFFSLSLLNSKFCNFLFKSGPNHACYAVYFLFLQFRKDLCLTFSDSSI